MQYGFIKVAAVTPELRVADPAYNATAIVGAIRTCRESGAKLIVFPELALTGFSCGDLFLQPRLLQEAGRQLIRICESCADADALIAIGLPVEVRGKLYDVAAVLHRGELLAFVPKRVIGPEVDQRSFVPGVGSVDLVEWEGRRVPFGTDILFSCEGMPHLTVAVGIGHELRTIEPLLAKHAAAGATVFCHLDAECAGVGNREYRRRLMRTYSATCSCALIRAAAGNGESTTDGVFDGHDLIAENGILLAEAEPFKDGVLLTEIDVDLLTYERSRNPHYPSLLDLQNEDRSRYVEAHFALDQADTALTRTFDPHPFAPEEESERTLRCEEILNIQAFGLKKRLAHTHCEKAVLGISGGLDSTLALLVAARAMDLLGLPRGNIMAVTMPGFGTTDRTYENACTLIRCIGATFREIPIRDAVQVHFRDIGQDEGLHDATYENAQARERTQILMDLGNQIGGLVVGTGDLSELALGWATYNGDHMSMYGVNGGVPKTLLRHLVSYYADTCGDKELSSALKDVLDTPVSPELLPPEDGKIAQKTEELVGPYELHDFFLYYMLRRGFSPAKVYHIARQAFHADLFSGENAVKEEGDGSYSAGTILTWLKVFYRRFFSQQFKRSCLPDGPKIGSVSLSPRGALRMPSDACAQAWLTELEGL